MSLPRLSQGIDAAGIKRFPTIGQVFNSLKHKKQRLSELDHEHVVLSMACGAVEKHGTKSDDTDGLLCMPIKDIADNITVRAGEDLAPVTPLAIKQMVASDPWVRSTVCTEQGHMQVRQGVREELDAHYNKRKQAIFAKYLPMFDSVRNTPLGASEANEQQLQNEIRQLVVEREPCKENQETVDKIVKTVGLVGRRVMEGARVNAELFGSRRYNLATNTSDVDIMLSVRVPSQDAEVNHAKFFSRFAKRLRNTPGFRVQAMITHARVPIVKFQFRSRHGGCFQGDISLNSSMGLSKSRMIETYVNMDSRVKDVMSVVRAWAEARNITCSHCLNSYALSMMILAFLIGRRVVPPLQLTKTHQFTRSGWRRLEEIQHNPDLIRDLYDNTISGGRGAVISCIETGEPLPDWRVDGTRAYFMGTQTSQQWVSPNKHSSATLVYEFFRYYGFDFDPMQHAVSVRLGSPEIPRMSLYELQAPEPS
ncbi:hypothetical protein EC988_005584, partial [Linderina pennispora]